MGKVIRHGITGVVCLVGLVIFLSFVGGQWSDTFDDWGQGMRQSMDRPIGVNVVNTPRSPKGEWQIKIESKQWTWRNTDRTTQYTVQGLQNGQPYLAGANLDLARNAHQFAKWQTEWQTDSAISFTDDKATRPTAALTIENATGEALPCLFICDAVQAHYLFGLAAGAKQTLTQIPAPAQGEPLTVILGPHGRTLKMKAPAGTPKTLKITLKKDQPDEAVMDL